MMGTDPSKWVTGREPLRVLKYMLVVLTPYLGDAITRVLRNYLVCSGIFRSGSSGLRALPFCVREKWPKSDHVKITLARSDGPPLARGQSTLAGCLASQMALFGAHHGGYGEYP